MNRDTLESQLFTWEGWDQDGPMDLSFSEITLSVPIGQFEKGAKLPAAFFVGSAGLLILLDEKDEQHAFDLKISVGEKVDLDSLKCDDACDCGHEHEEHT